MKNLNLRSSNDVKVMFGTAAFDLSVRASPELGSRPGSSRTSLLRYPDALGGLRGCGVTGGLAISEEGALSLGFSSKLIWS